jgi:EAL domain-containing protein (putative c-di-GMP-specific phosphodiesterase class I)
VFANPEQQTLTKERFDLERELRFAIDHDQLLLHYQPKVSLRSRRLVGFEALIRWQHPERGLLPPDLFLPLAEQANLLRPLTAWAFDAAGRQTRAWLDQGLRPVPVAVNATPDEFLNALLEQHLPAYQSHRVPTGLLEVEITESAMISGFREVSAIVEALRPHGILVAIDDFGTGYASLSSLKELPVATLKIDRAFTVDLQHDAASRAVAACIISIARELGLKVVAEGVETEAQLHVLAGLRCNIVQGYLTGRPVPADEAARMLRPSRRIRPRLTSVPVAITLPAMSLHA